MNAILRRGGERPSAHNLRRLLSAALHATLERMTVPYRDVPPELFRLPPF